MESPKSLKNWSWLARAGLIVAIGICANVLCGLFGLATHYGSLFISFLTSLLSAPLFDRNHPFKWVVGVVCLIGFLIGVSGFMTGYGRGFVHGFKNSYNQGYSQYNNR